MASLQARYAIGGFYTVGASPFFSGSADCFAGDRPSSRSCAVDTGTWIVLAICAGVTIVLGIVPAVFVHWAQDATLLTQVITWIH